MIIEEMREYSSACDVVLKHMEHLLVDMEYMFDDPEHELYDDGGLYDDIIRMRAVIAKYKEDKKGRVDTVSKPVS